MIRRRTNDRRKGYECLSSGSLYRMNKRLELIYSMISDGRGLIDVGTDHGYLPAALAVNGYSGRLFASDINAMPLEKARETARRCAMVDRITFLLSDGLDACPPEEIDTIVMAGMSGELICTILDRAEWCLDEQYTLILQPMTKAEVLRYWLVYNEFAIESESIVEDAGTLYQIISARFGGNTRLTDAELFTGKRALCADPGLFDCQTMRIIARFEKAIDGMRSGKGEARFGLYVEILDQLLEMSEKK